MRGFLALHRRQRRARRLRDGGSLEERSKNVAYWHQWPAEYDHLIQKWDEFLNA